MTTKLLNSDDVIEIMISVSYKQTSSDAYSTRYGEALRSLVLLARAEQLLEMQRDFNSLTQFGDTRSPY